MHVMHFSFPFFWFGHRELCLHLHSFGGTLTVSHSFWLYGRIFCLWDYHLWTPVVRSWYNHDGTSAWATAPVVLSVYPAHWAEILDMSFHFTVNSPGPTWLYWKLMNPDPGVQFRVYSHLMSPVVPSIHIFIRFSM